MWTVFGIQRIDGSPDMVPKEMTEDLWAWSWTLHLHQKEAGAGVRSSGLRPQVCMSNIGGLIVTAAYARLREPAAHYRQ